LCHRDHKTKLKNHNKSYQWNPHESYSRPTTHETVLWLEPECSFVVTPGTLRKFTVIMLLVSSYGLVIGLVRWFRGALILIKIVSITFNVIKTIYSSFHWVDIWLANFATQNLSDLILTWEFFCVLATIFTLSVLKLAS